MNSGFKGTQVGISEISIKSRATAGTVIQYKCLFTDAEGTAHGQIVHEVEASNPLFGELIKSLVGACRAHATTTHFTDPETTDKKVTINGIFEALSGAVDTSDGAGEPG